LPLPATLFLPAAGGQIPSAGRGRTRFLCFAVCAFVRVCCLLPQVIIVSFLVCVPCITSGDVLYRPRITPLWILAFLPRFWPLDVLFLFRPRGPSACGRVRLYAHALPTAPARCTYAWRTPCRLPPAPLPTARVLRCDGLRDAAATLGRFRQHSLLPWICGCADGSRTLLRTLVGRRVRSPGPSTNMDRGDMFICLLLSFSFCSSVLTVCGHGDG